MPRKFDPIATRRFWLDGKYEWGTFVPAELTRMNRAISISGEVNVLLQAYYVGLADQVRPTLEKMIGWMESQPETEPRQHSKDFGHWRAGWTDLYLLREALGLCKWLSRGDPAQNDFARALNAEWYSWTEVSPNDAAVDYGERLDSLTQHLAMAIAAKDPVLGLKFLELADWKKRLDGFDELEIPLLQFGEWACRHLAGGGKQNAGFVSPGIEMLSVGLPDFFLGARRAEAALWLKAIFWDTGMVRTPDQAIAKIYDFLPGVERPDLVPA